MSRWIGAALLAAARPRLRRIAEWQRDPAPAQDAMLRRLLRAAQNTRFGREHDFASIHTPADFAARVPLREYLDFKPWWDRLFQGEQDVTWPGRITYFPITSGTTAGNKLIPLSPQGIRSQFRTARDLFYFYLAQTRNVEVFSGRFLYLGGSTDLRREAHGLRVGDLSAIMALHMPFYATWRRLPSRRVTFIANWEQKLHAMAEEALAHDVRGLSGTPSWLLSLFERVLALRRERGLPARTLADLWPNLSLLIHGGCSFDPYRKSFAEHFGKPVTTMEVYPASEGFIAYQDRVGADDLLLSADTGIFYEFVPVEDLDAPTPRRFTVADVETDVNYAVVLTTNSGLWGYVIGDTVRFTSLRPHRLRVTGRTRQFLNAFGEHLIVEEAEAAIAEASQATQAEVRDFHVAPIFDGSEATPHTDASPLPPTHQWLVEFVRAPKDLAQFRDILDAVVKRRNDDYASHRQGDAGMRPPELVALPQGTFYETMRAIGKLGGQNKVPRLGNTRAFADRLLHSAAALQGPQRTA